MLGTSKKLRRRECEKGTILPFAAKTNSDTSINNCLLLFARLPACLCLSMTSRIHSFKIELSLTFGGG